MFYWLKYFPIRLWDDYKKKGFAKGPYTRFCLPQRIKLGDSILRFKAPYTHRVWMPFSPSSKRPENIGCRGDALSQASYYVYSGRVGEVGRWNSHVAFRREWYFVSPWFGGAQYGLQMSVNVVSADDIKPFDNINLLHPRAFEAALAEYLDLAFGTQTQERYPQYKGPCNWRLLNISPFITAARFDVKDNIAKPEYDIKRDLVTFPIGPRQFIAIRFWDLGSDGPNAKTRNGRDGRELIEKIVSSFKLEVGPQTQAQWDEAKAQCPDMSLTEEFGLLKWPVKAEDVGKSTALPEMDHAQLADKK